ncbi:hypothetical protein AVEN_142439-1 [Araneus ventricosus]|uniref:Uncharacterized protein n=1 Tax=Araneus ventricosus TaxID=182803 RepID=A0A4Y2S3L5_ARAVE|nr:hypothetical protein AVEN_142439-1 [Araneus ventricosus]
MTTVYKTENNSATPEMMQFRSFLALFLGKCGITSVWQPCSQSDWPRRFENRSRWSPFHPRREPHSYGCFKRRGQQSSDSKKNSISQMAGSFRNCFLPRFSRILRRFFVLRDKVKKRVCIVAGSFPNIGRQFKKPAGVTSPKLSRILLNNLSFPLPLRG